MTVYAVDKLIEETRRLAAEFRSSTGTMLPVSGEIARYDVARLLGFQLCEQRDLGYDAVTAEDDEGRKVLVKSRVIVDQVKSGHRIGQLNTDADWDLVALSIMDEAFEPQEIYLASRDSILEALDQQNSNRAKRGALSVAKFMNISELVWTVDLGKLDADSVYAIG